jgi:carbon storage regulator
MQVTVVSNCIIVETAIYRRNIMLVLNRKSGQRVIIGDDVTVVILEIRGSQVKLGISGPKCVPIHREEVFQKIAKEDRSGELAQTM